MPQLDFALMSETALDRLFQSVILEKHPRQVRDLARFRQFRNKHLPQDMVLDTDSDDGSLGEFSDALHRVLLQFVQKLEKAKHRVNQLQGFRALVTHRKAERKDQFSFSLRPSEQVIEL